MVRTWRPIPMVVVGSSMAWALAFVAPPPREPAPGSLPARTGEIASDHGRDGDLAATVAELVAAHNRVRAAHRRGPLAVNPLLEAAAREHALDMARHRWMSHFGSDLSNPVRRIVQQGYDYRCAGENVAAGYDSV